MGGIVSAFSAVVSFFENIALVGVTIGNLFPTFINDPLKFFLRLILLLVGSFLGFGLWMLWILWSLPAEAIFYVVGLWIAWWFAVLSTIAVMALWTVYFLVTLVIYTGDFFSGGWLLGMFLCEDGVDAWAFRGNYAGGNTCSRNMLCVRPCSDRYSPVLAGTMCMRNATYRPALCPQQLAYLSFAQASDPIYADSLASASNIAGPKLFDAGVTDPSFKLLTKKGKENYLRQAYSDKLSFLTTCFEGMDAFEAVTKHIFANARLLLPPGAAQDLVVQLGAQLYCDYKYQPKGAKASTTVARSADEAESFCNQMADDGPVAPDEDAAAVVVRIMLWLAVLTAVYMVVLTTHRVWLDMHRTRV